jgi:ABC-type oligopeptide transport system substrate-binding subunit
MKRKTFTKKFAALAMTFVLTGSLAGCGSGSSETASTDEGTQQQSEISDEETQTQQESTEAQNVADDSPHVLNWIADGEVTTMDNNKSYDTISWNALEYFNDTLYRLNSDNEAIPSLALDYPTLSDDGLTATIEIRHDAYYSNGENIKAADIVYSAKRIVDPETGSQAASNINYIKNASAVASGDLPVDDLGISAPDDYTLVIEL